MKNKNEYFGAFIFGIKFTSLLLCLLIPIILGAAFSFGAYSLSEKIPFFYKDSLEVNLIYSYNPKQNGEKLKIEYLYEIETNKGNFYASTNRGIKTLDEKEKFKKQIIEILEDEDTKKLRYLDSPPEKNEYIYFPKEWDKTIIYASLTTVGNVFMSIIVIVTIIFCIALYFPIFRGFINLFRKKNL